MSRGASSGRPCCQSRPAMGSNLSSVGFSIYLVSISEGLSWPKTFESFRSPARILSWIQRSHTAMCRTLPRPRRRQIPIAAVASLLSSISKSKPRSGARAWHPSALAAPLDNPRQLSIPRTQCDGGLGGRPRFHDVRSVHQNTSGR